MGLRHLALILATGSTAAANAEDLALARVFAEMRDGAIFLHDQEREVDPDGVPPLDERARQAASARKAHMLRLAAKSVQARQRRKQAT